MLKKLNNGTSLHRILIALLLVFAALLSCTFVADRTMSPETHADTIQSLDEKKDIVMALTASSTLASAMISAIPDDTATPISDKLADLTSYFLIVLCVLYAEKYLLTIVGAGSFWILIPGACLCGIVFLFHRRDWLKRLAVKLLIVGILLYLAIPASIRVSDMIYSTYETSIHNTIEEAEQISEDAEHLADEEENLWSKISGAATNLKDNASKILNRFVEALAVLIVTTCIIPLLVLLFFLWLIRTFLGIDLSFPEKLTKKRLSSQKGTVFPESSPSGESR